jgi:hypothetical protein
MATADANQQRRGQGPAICGRSVQRRPSRDDLPTSRHRPIDLDSSTSHMPSRDGVIPDNPLGSMCDPARDAGLSELVAGVGGTARTARSLLLPDGDGVYHYNTFRAGRTRGASECDRDVVELGLVTHDFAKVLFDK